MPYINAEEKEISFKVVYYGPGMSGKTTNLMHIHRALEGDVRGELISLDTAEERTLFFDFLPVELGRIDGYALRFNMYTIPGQVHYEACRRLILEGADGVVFVADSQPHQKASNVDSFIRMQDNLRFYEMDPQDFPLVLQYNKRDCDNPLPVGVMERALGLNGIPVFEAVATRGLGVMETIRKLSRQIIQQLHT
jgi:signal recognition particle receptor subunit beta